MAGQKSRSRLREKHRLRLLLRPGSVWWFSTGIWLENKKPPFLIRITDNSGFCVKGTLLLQEGTKYTQGHFYIYVSRINRDIEYRVKPAKEADWLYAILNDGWSKDLLDLEEFYRSITVL